MGNTLLDLAYPVAITRYALTRRPNVPAKYPRYFLALLFLSGRMRGQSPREAVPHVLIKQSVPCLPRLKSRNQRPESENRTGSPGRTFTHPFSLRATNGLRKSNIARLNNFPKQETLKQPKTNTKDQDQHLWESSDENRGALAREGVSVLGNLCLELNVKVLSVTKEATVALQDSAA